MLEIDVLRNSLQNILDVLKGDFWGFGCPNAQMPCWLRICSVLYLVDVVEIAALLWPVAVAHGDPILR